jgi:hypothetical protein
MGGNAAFIGKPPSDRRGGITEITEALYLSQNRACKESEAPSEDWSEAPPQMTTHELVKASSEQYSPVISFIENAISRRIGEIGASAKESATSNHFDSIITEPNVCDFTSAIPSHERLIEAINDYATQILKASLDQSCRNAPIFSTSLQVQAHDNKGDFLPKLSALLDRGRPVGIGYNYCGLLKDVRKTSCPHASVVVGRNYNKATGKCQLLVRNSHGASCKQYEDMDVQCTKETPGYFWVDEDKLDEQVSDFNWIENNPKYFGVLGQKKNLF